MKPIKSLIFGLATALTATGATAADYEFKLHHFLSAVSSAQVNMLEPWARAVEENSGGRVHIEVFPSMTLGGRPPELINQVRDGVVDLVWAANGYTPGIFPRTEVFELPNVHRDNAAATNLAMRDLFASDLAAEYKGVEVMFLHVHAGQALQMRDRAVRRPEDLAGMNLRIPTRTGAWVIEALGAAPAAMPVTELPSALQKGVVDGALIPFEVIPYLKIADQTEYQIEGANGVRFGTTTFQLSMNKARWEGLPEDIQQAFRDASGPDWVAKVGDIWTEADQRGIDEAVAAGNHHVVLTEDETATFAAAMEPVVDRWIEETGRKGIDGAGLIAKARAAIANRSED